MVTVLLGGLWHGAAWTFVLWGALNGTYLVLRRWWQQRRSIKITDHSSDESMADRHTARGLLSYIISKDFVCWLLAVALTYGCVTFAFIIFRVDSLADAVTYIQGIIAFRGECRSGPWR